MTRDEIKKIIGEGATEEQVTNMLNLYHNSKKADEQKAKELETKLNSYSDYDELKKKLSDIEKANMTEQEKLARDKEEIAKQLKEAKITNNTAKAKEVLAGLNISDNLLHSLVTDDETATLANANELLNHINNLKDEVVKQTKENLTTLDLTPNIDNSAKKDETMTFDKFRTLSQDEQNKFAQEHPEEFKNL